jgi:hypothetical protein
VRETIEFVLPIERITAALRLIDGSRHDVVLFVPIGETFRDLLESPLPFLPAREGKSIRIYARAQIATITVAAPPTSVTADGPPPREVPVNVQLVGDQAVRGTMRYVARFERPRTADHLNEEGRWFQIEAGGELTHVAKAHVLYVEEV